MELNYFIIPIAAILSIVIGILWYGPFFGSLWLTAIGARVEDLEKRREMQRNAMPLYAIQFLLALLQAYILLRFITSWNEVDGVTTGFLVWLGFVMPTVAASALWNNNSNKVKLTMFAIQAGYQFVMFMIFGWLLGEWSYIYE